MLTENQKKYLIELIEKGQSIPEDFRYMLFPTEHEEYELAYAGKMRKEDLLANEDGTFPIPLQVEKIFNGKKYEKFEDNWKNMIVYGDNLQFLKTIYEDEDPIIKGRVKGKVKLIYIDPPFATEEDFQNKLGAKAYNDKKKGAEFIEFIRRRLIIAREILAEDGAIIVHLDWKKAHYIKVVMDEVFGETNFLNEIIWYYRRWNIASNMFARNHDNLLYYAKNKGKHTFNNLYIPKSEKSSGDGKAWLSVIDEETGKRKSILQDKESKGVPMPDVFEVSMINPMALERRNVNYPTQKPEALLSRLIQATTNEGDIVMDFFGGSGTTMSVAEKLNRRWITCDLGKLSYFTMQKRLLQISDSKALNSDKKYNKKPKSFMTTSLGVYDLEKTLNLDWETYKKFVSQLFEIDRDPVDINGISFEGTKRNFPVKIFNYEKYSKSGIDDSYLRNLLLGLGSKAPSRIYIISPATRVNYIADYEEIDNTKFYFLKVPYEMIRELHMAPFIKLRQPRSKKDINEIEQMKGFQFNYKPEISCNLVDKGEYVDMVLDKFSSYSIQQGESEDFTTLSSIFVNYDYNGESFIMDDVKFWDEIDKPEKANSEIKFTEEDDKIKAITWRFSKEILGKYPMFIFSDIFGNDIVVKFELGE